MDDIKDVQKYASYEFPFQLPFNYLEKKASLIFNTFVSSKETK